jgi:hypothetical protein
MICWSAQCVTTVFVLSQNAHTVLNLTYQRSNVSELLISGNKDGLYEELVAALRIWRRVLLHGLEKNCVHVLVCHTYCNGPGIMARTLDFDIFAWFNAPTIRPHTVSTTLLSAGWHGAEVVGHGLWDAYCLGAVCILVYVVSTRLVFRMYTEGTYCLYFEGDGVRVWVLEVQCLGDLLLEGACSLQSRRIVHESIAHLTLEAQFYGIELDRHCGRTSSGVVLRGLCW